MPTLDEIYKQIKDISWADPSDIKKEVLELPNILLDAEKILGLISGGFDRRIWLIALTQRRIIFLNKRFFGRLNQFEMLLDKINSVESENRMIYSGISFKDSMSSITMGYINKKLFLLL